MPAPDFPFYLKPAVGSFYTTQDLRQLAATMETSIKLHNLKIIEEGLGWWLCANDHFEFEVRVWQKDAQHFVEVRQLDGCRWAFHVVAKEIRQQLMKP